MRGELRKTLPDHVHDQVGEGDGAKVLQADQESVRRDLSGNVQDGLRDVVHDQVRGQGERDEARRRDELREDSRHSMRAR